MNVILTMEVVNRSVQTISHYLNVPVDKVFNFTTITFVQVVLMKY